MVSVVPAPDPVPAADRAVEALAAQQCGRFSRHQLRELGVARSTVDTRLRSGRWRRESSAVLRLPGAPTGEAAELWSALLHVGTSAVVSHSSAGRRHDIPAVADLGPHLTVPMGGHRRAEGINVHQSRRLDADHVTVIDGMPVTTLTRTLVDLAPTASPIRIETWIDHLTAERRLRPIDLVRTVDDLYVGRRGLRGLIKVLGERLPGDGVEQGRLERLLTSVLAHAGLGAGVPQHPHPGRSTGPGLVDRAFPAARLIIEVDGRRWHDRRLAHLSDIRRDRDAAAAGWLTVRYVYAEVARAGSARGAEIAEIHERRLVDIGRAG